MFECYIVQMHRNPHHVIKDPCWCKPIILYYYVIDLVKLEYKVRFYDVR